LTKLLIVSKFECNFSYILKFSVRFTIISKDINLPELLYVLNYYSFYVT